MSAITAELEQALAQEIAEQGAPESAFEAAHENEGEHEAFFNHLAAMGDRSGRSHALRRVALAAARAALRTQSAPPRGIEGELESEALAEFEFEAAAQTRSPAQIDAMLEHIGHSAAEAANEQEAAERFLPLIPLAAKALLPIAARTLGGAVARIGPQIIRRVAPTLTRALANTTRTLFRSPTARPLLHAVPRIARSTIAQLARRVSRGQPVNPRIAVRTLARNTYRTLSAPRALVHAYRRSLRADRRHHSRIGRLVGATPGQYRHAVGSGGAGARSAAPVSPYPSSPTQSAASTGGPLPAVPAIGPGGAAPIAFSYWYPLPTR